MIVRKWIRTNLRPSVASVGLSFLGITLWNIPPHDLSGHGTEEHVAGRVEEHDVDVIMSLRRISVSHNSLVV